MTDAFHEFGNDLVIGPTGELLMVQGSQETQQRLIRRLLTPQGSYLWNLAYGCGAAQQVGTNITTREIGAIKSALLAAALQEPGVAQQPTPEIDIQVTDNGVIASVRYTDAQTKKPAVIYVPVQPA